MTQSTLFPQSEQYTDKEWADAIKDELVIHHLYCRSTPRTQISALLDYVQAIALDPAVSHAAQELRDSVPNQLVEAINKLIIAQTKGHLHCAYWDTANLDCKYGKFKNGN